MKVAIVHDWLVTFAGAERVLQQMLLVFPDADIYCLLDFLPASEREFLGGRSVHTSFLQCLPGAGRHYRSLLPLMPYAVEQFDLSQYDLVISSSYAVAKGVLTGPHQLHVCYCHSPIRYAWDLQHQYLRESGLSRGLRSAMARYILHRIRLWDVRSSNGVDWFIAGSHFVSRRIAKFYRRRSVVIYPPVDVDAFTPGDRREDFYVTASRMVPYKRIDLIQAHRSDCGGVRGHAGAPAGRHR
jgi:glycosyltransferase involved in cell wall biosynthesis